MFINKDNKNPSAFDTFSLPYIMFMNFLLRLRKSAECMCERMKSGSTKWEKVLVLASKAGGRRRTCFRLRGGAAESDKLTRSRFGPCFSLGSVLVYALVFGSVLELNLRPSCCEARALTGLRRECSSLAQKTTKIQKVRPHFKESFLLSASVSSRLKAFGPLSPSK